MKPEGEDPIEAWERPLLKLAAEWLEEAVSHLGDGGFGSPEVQLTFSREQGSESVLVVTDAVMGNVHIAVGGAWFNPETKKDIVEPEVIALTSDKSVAAVEKALRRFRKLSARYGAYVDPFDEAARLDSETP